MKKFILTLFVVIMTLLVMSGCSDKSIGDTVTENNIETSTDIVGTVGCNQDNQDKKNVPNKIENPDFRNIQWGMSLDEVINHEELELVVVNDKDVATNDKVSVCGHDMIVAYTFNSNDELYRAGYLLMDGEYSNNNMYVNAFDDVLAGLVEKYGDPITCEDQWSRHLYENDPEHYGLAVARGDYRRIATWDLPTTHIQLALFGNNYDLCLRVQYTSIEFNADKDDNL